MTGAVLAAIGSGVINSAGQIYANNQNIASQQAINAANIAAQYGINDANLQAAAINNQTAVNLANTAHQREVRDLRDAGLNPILSTRGAGAETPNLSTPNLEAPMSQAATISNPLGGIASALSNLQANQDKHLLDELNARLLDTQIPNGKDGLLTLKGKAGAEAHTAISQAHAEQARYEYEQELWEQRRNILREGIWFNPTEGIKVRRNPQEATVNLMDAIQNGVFNDIANPHQNSFMNGVNAMGNWINSAFQIHPAYK